MQNSSLWSSHDLLNKVYAHWIDRFHFILFFRWYKSPSGKLSSFLWVHCTIEDPKQDQFLSSLCKIFSLSFPYVVVVFFSSFFICWNWIVCVFYSFMFRSSQLKYKIFWISMDCTLYNRKIPCVWFNINFKRLFPFLIAS